MVEFEVSACYGHKISRKSAETIILSEYLKLKEKSGFNFMKTRIDWERLDFAKN